MRDFPSSLDTCLCLAARSRPTFPSYWTKVQYTAFSLYARSRERRVTRRVPFLTLHSILFPRHSLARPRYYRRKRDAWNKRTRIFRAIDGCFVARSAIGQAAEPQQPGTQETSDEELVKETQNPVADLITVPLQNNFNFGTGSKNRTVYVGNIQPVIPIHITDDWNLITRTIMPIINQPSLFPGTGSATGLGDINPTFFFSPAKPGELIWGVGTDIHFADRHRLPDWKRQI